MLKSHITIAFRNLLRHKGYASINVVGLAIAMAAAVLILFYVRHEQSFDRFHENADRVYRVVMDVGFGAGVRVLAPAGPYFAEQFPGIEAAARMYKEQTVLKRGADLVTETRFYYADPSFFRVFSYDLVAGDPATALNAPGSVMLTNTAALHYFGDANPLGQTLMTGGGVAFRVTGVLQDPPSNTHLPFDFIASFATLPEMGAQGYKNQLPSFTYLLLQSGTDPSAIQERLDSFTKQDVGAIAGILGLGVDGMRFTLQPLPDIHLHSRLMGEAEPNGDARLVRLFSALAVFLLLIAAVNYMNLATARALQRAREVGIRKVVGAGRLQLATQFLGEALLLCSIAFVLALGLAELLLSAFAQITGRSLETGALLQTTPWAWLALLALGMGLIAGSYPAFYLSRFQPVHVLKGKGSAGQSGRRVRQVLVVFQFTVTILLITGNLFVREQVNYTQSRDLGYDVEHIIEIPMQGSLQHQPQGFKESVEQISGVRAISASSGFPPGNGTSSHVTLREGQDILTRYLAVDDDYLSTLGMRLIAGRNFHSDGDSTAMLLNETAARQFGLMSEVGQTLDAPFEGRQLVGIVSDFHMASLHEPILPATLQLTNWDRAYFPGKFVVRLAPEHVPATLERLETLWKAFVPDHPFTYHFLDEVVRSQHLAERRLSYLTSAFALVAIIIACLGLFALASFTAEKRTKEIGIRKVLGATAASLVVLLSKDFVRLVLIAFMVAVPLAYITMSHWLEDFSYRIDLGPGIFLLAGGAALAIALLTVSYQALRAALTDPVKALRYE